ncbi:hypothetical protein [Thermomonospora amylolytica]|uniref:hypothetical protein n=1 Tax=Thermomonospora amylolytica TaxID=1411117 RepID=UPI001F299814|nr:hypothetical protein [Thermomonospora amylolytica]
MADVTEVRQADRVDALMVHLARGRVALGAAAFLAPGVTARVLGLGKGPDAGRDMATRLFASREIALGAGYLLGKGQSRSAWARLGVAVDALDAIASIKSRRARGGPAVPLWAAAAFSAVALGATGLGAAKVAKDLTG